MTGRDDSEPFFEAIAGRYERAYALDAQSSRERLRRVIAALPPPPAAVLDLGVGTGRELSALLDAGYHPTGVDRSPAMLERCRRRARPVPLVRADFWPRATGVLSSPGSRTLPFDDASFDAALALHGTLAHPPDVEAPERLAVELARLVRRGGRFVAEVPSPAWIRRLEQSAGANGEPRVTRTGEKTCTIEDRVVGASVSVRTFDAAEWEQALAPFGRAEVHAIEGVEWLIEAERA